MHSFAITTGFVLSLACLSSGLPADSNDLSIIPAQIVLESPPLLARDTLAAEKPDRCCSQNNVRSCLAGHVIPGAELCCSESGFSGITDAHCGKGCQPGYRYCQGKKRDPPQSQCGPKAQGRKCANNECCSHAGHCGTGKDYCSVPSNCQRAFGRCDSDDVPPGTPTSRDDRRHVGKVSYKHVIKKCTKPRTIAMTFDDGPSHYIKDLLDLLNKHDAKATFFISPNTNGKGEVDKVDAWTHAIRRMDHDGHQVASHTWSHPHLDGLTSSERKEEMQKTERAIANIIGKYPSYMRAPYIECSARSGCQKDMSDLGYHRVAFEVDSGDWDSRMDLESMKNTVTKALDRKREEDSMLLIQHDIYPHAVDLTGHILAEVKRKGWKAVTVAECLKEPLTNAYQYPRLIEAGPIAKGGCIVSQPGFCGEFRPFDDRVSCFKSNAYCLKQLQEGDIRDRKKSYGYREMKKICDNLFLFCAQCGKKDAIAKCKSDKFVFKR